MVFRGVPGMFRGVPGCSGVFRVGSGFYRHPLIWLTVDQSWGSKDAKFRILSGRQTILRVWCRVTVLSRNLTFKKINSNLISVMWSTTLAHILKRWRFHREYGNSLRLLSMFEWQLRRFLVKIYKNYLPKTCPRLDGKRRVELGKLAKIWETVGLGGPSVGCLPCLFFLLLLGAVTVSEELTASKPHQVTKYHTNDKSLVSFIYLAYRRSKFGIKICKIQYFMEYFSRSVDSSRGQSLQITGDPIRRNGGMTERHGGMVEWRNILKHRNDGIS